MERHTYLEGAWFLAFLLTSIKGTKTLFAKSINFFNLPFIDSDYLQSCDQTSHKFLLSPLVPLMKTRYTLPQQAGSSVVENAAQKHVFFLFNDFIQTTKVKLAERSTLSSRQLLNGA